MDPIQRRLAGRIRTLRRKRGLTQVALAAKAGLSRGYVARLELGYHDPALSVLVKLARALRVSIADLLT